jgi:hypothetical protein
LHLYGSNVGKLPSQALPLLGNDLGLELVLGTLNQLETQVGHFSIFGPTPKVNPFENKEYVTMWP